MRTVRPIASTFSSLPGKAGWVGAATTFTSPWTNQGSSVTVGQVQCLQHPAPRPLIFLPPSSSSQSWPPSRHTRKWKTKLEDPRLVRHKLVGRRGSICPRMVARSTWLEGENAHLGGENETTHHNQVASHPHLLAFLLIITTISPPSSAEFPHLIPT